MRRRAQSLIAAALLGCGLSACTLTGIDPVPVPPPRPDRPEPPPTRSEASLEAERYYGRVQADLLSQGLLRTDGGGPDVPFSKRQLVDNFVRIALFDEYAPGGALIAQQTASRLRRWQGPVRIRLTFGDSVPQADRSKDTANITTYARRLARVTSHPIAVTTGANANFDVLVLGEDERREIGPTLRKLIPGISPTAVRTIETMPRDTFCIVFAFSGGSGSDYVRALAVVRAEHPDLLRTSCYHEEIAQGLGLANDSPFARPSIFNDDEEFGLLTTHDELLLRMLYDDRMRTGMTEPTARPVANVIASELTGGET